MDDSGSSGPKPLAGSPQEGLGGEWLDYALTEKQVECIDAMAQLCLGKRVLLLNGIRCGKTLMLSRALEAYAKAVASELTSPSPYVLYVGGLMCHRTEYPAILKPPSDLDSVFAFLDTI
jgi:hypothetical protein